MGGLLAGLLESTTLARGAAVFSRSTKMLGTGRTIAAVGNRIARAAPGAALKGAKFAGRVGWKSAKYLGLGAAALWSMGGGGGRGEIQLGNEDSYGPGGTGTGTGTGTNTAAVVTELPGLKSPDQPEKISAPTVATIIQSVDRLAGIATGIADNLLNLQNILVGQIEQSSDAAREAMIENRPMPQVATQESGTGDLEGALGNLAAAANPEPSLIQKLIGGALTTWGIGSLIKGFFTKSAAAKAAEARAAVVTASETAATAASRTATVLRTTGVVSRFAGKALGPVSAVTGTMGAIDAYKQNRTGDFLLESGTALTGAGTIAGMFGASAAVIAPAALALGTALSLMSIPFLAGEEARDQALSRQLLFSKKIPLYVRTPNSSGVNMSVPDHAVLAGVNVPYDDWPKELKELYHFYVSDGNEADAKKVENNKAKYTEYENALRGATTLAEVAKASAIVSGEDAGFKAVVELVGGDETAADTIKDNWQTPGAIEAKIHQRMRAKYYQAQKFQADAGKKPKGYDPDKFNQVYTEYQSPLNETQIAAGQSNARNASARQNAEGDPIGANVDIQGPHAGKYAPEVSRAQRVEKFGEEVGVGAAGAAPIAPRVYNAAATQTMDDVYAIPFNKKQRALRPIGPETIDPTKYTPGLKISKKGTYSDFGLPTTKPVNKGGYNGQGEPVELGYVPNPSFDAGPAYDAKLFFMPSTTAAT